MLRPSAAALAIAVGTFASTLALLSPHEADAKYRRVAAVTSCVADDLVFDDLLTWSGDKLYATHEITNRSGSGLSINLHTGDTVGVRCQVPTDSYLPHDTMTEAHVSGNKSGGNGFASYVKACHVWWQNGSYSCGNEVTLASGNFNAVVPIGSVWNDGASFPMITAVLADGDRLFGVYYTDQ